MNKFLIFLILFFSYTFYKLYDFFDLDKSISEIGLTKCSQLNLWNACIESQAKYQNYFIISACNKCDCSKNGASFHSFEIATNEVKPIEINSKIDLNFKAKSINVFDNYLFVVNEFNNTVIVYELQIKQRLISLTYFYSIPVEANYQLDSVLALQPYEMIATVQNKSSIYNGNNYYMKIFYDFLSYFGFQPQSFILYLRNDIYKNRNDIKPVEGTQASKLSGISFDKEYRVFIGRPLEKAVGVYKYKGYKSFGFYLSQFLQIGEQN